MTDALPIGTRVWWRGKVCIVETRCASGWARLHPELAYLTIIDLAAGERYSGLQQCDVVPVGCRLIVTNPPVRLVVDNGDTP